MSFTNSIVAGGGSLVRSQIKSPNFVTGVSGWIIRRDGSAEFDNLTIRGTFFGTDFEINSLGTFFYSGLPAAGNLIASITSAGGADDGHGNPFLSGINSYNQAANSFAELFNDQLALGLINAPLLAGALRLKDTTGAGSQSVQLFPPITIAGDPKPQITLKSAAYSDSGFPSVLLTSGAIPSGDVTTDELLEVHGGIAITLGGGGTIIYPPSGDATGATDAAEVQAILNLGFNVKLTDGHYYANALVAYPPSQEIRGTGWGFGGNGTNWNATVAIDACFASAGWQTNANNAGARDPVTISNMKISCNSLATYGVVTQNYRSTFRDLFIEGAVSDAFRMDAFGKNGTTEITGSAVENYIEHCTFQSPGGAGLNVHDGANTHFTDGFLLNCLIASPDSDAVIVPHSAGWLFDGNHLYGLPKNGFNISAFFNTRVTNNYIESWGSSATAAFYSGIRSVANFANGPGSIIAGNVMNLSTAPGNAGSTIQGIGYQTGTGGTSDVLIADNVLRCAPVGGAITYTGIAISNGGAGTTTNFVTNTSNMVYGTWINNLLQTPNGGVINHNAGV
jgi:hypothetical protein